MNETGALQRPGFLVQVDGKHQAAFLLSFSPGDTGPGSCTLALGQALL